jgi:enoyl-CoA hydratase
MSTVLLEKHEGFAIVTLNRPEAMNALSRELRRDFVAAFTTCTEDPDIRVVILTGNGKAFCAGFDLKELGSGATTNTAEEADNIVAQAMEAFEGPIIGAINGHCITGGFEMALACDILIASENARFADTHARVGMLPGWGLSQKLPRLIGLSRAREIAFTGAPIFARQAYEWGLVNHVLAPEELLPRAIRMAQDICGCVPEVLREYQVLIEDGYAMLVSDALEWEAARAIWWAKQASGAAIEERRQGILEKGRSEQE